ncbi:MAG: putative toxin-antitoxin system toxin component, PIN family [Clostridiales bacterium]|jgi:putative PIN family toxin of toxin-antitoxin system|nr:putative toxin-antitoxin system toxin component, PIN family [Clostridiales bacterium]
MRRHVVLDTNVIVSALLTPGRKPHKVLHMFLTDKIALFYSPEILDEYERVLYKPGMRISSKEADAVLSVVHENGKRVWVRPGKIYMPDETDRVFYDVAKHVGAYLITGNKKHYPDEPFIVTSAAFLELEGDI